MQNSVVVLPFWVNLVQKIKIVILSLKFGTQSNLNMQNSMVMFTSSVLHWKYPFWQTLLKKKNQNYPSKLKFDTQTNFNLQNSVGMFTFMVLISNAFFGHTWPKNPKCLFKVKFAEFDGTVHLMFQSRNTLLGQILAKKSKLSV